MNDAGLAMSVAFLTQIPITHKFEGDGAISDDPNDPGGLTKWGWSLRWNPDLTADDIRNMTREQSTARYFTNKWVPLRLSQLPEWCGGKVFDTEVLAGSWGIRILQQALGVTDDGVIGPGTVSACRCARDPAILMDHYRALLRTHYDTICREHPDLTRFLRGWCARALS